MNVDIDIEAGEETSSTDGIIELQSIEYEESESEMISSISEDYMDVDVSIAENFGDDEAIEAILPKSPSHQVGAENYAPIKKLLFVKSFLDYHSDVQAEGQEAKIRYVFFFYLNSNSFQEELRANLA